MNIYTIIRVYKVPAADKTQAVSRMIESIVTGEEKGFHAQDLLREPGEKPGQASPVDLQATADWLQALKEQLDTAQKRLDEAEKRYFSK